VDDKQWDIIRPVIARMRASVMAVVFGLFAGGALFAATLWLVLQGGHMEGREHVVGPHLGLLENFYPGYEVTMGGAFIGFAYAGATGAVIAYVLAWIYNTIALRGGKATAPPPKG